MFEQERALTRLQQALLREPLIPVCLLVGSFGRKMQDDYADLDLIFAFPDEASRTAAHTQRRAFAQEVMVYVAVKGFDAEPFRYETLYANGTKVDYQYALQAELTPTAVWREMRVLKDAHGWGEQFALACAHAPLPTPPLITAADLEALDNQFWVLLWEVYRQLRRGDAQRPFATYLHLLHHTLPPLLCLLAPTDPAHQALIQASYGQDAGKNVAGLRPLLAAYVGARSAVIRQYRLIFTPNNGFEEGIRRFMER